MTVNLLVWVLFAFIGILAIPVTVFFVQVVFALCPVRTGRSWKTGERQSVALLVPAHDESLVIGKACRAFSEQLFSADRLLVVADNCSDDTADRARDAGAEVVVRQDTTKVGKGYAIDFGVRYLAKNPPAVLIVVDADCILGDHSVDRLVRDCLVTQRPVQATYTMRNPPGASLRMRIAEFAGTVKNLVRPLGFHNLGLPCMLMGTGMAFPWNVISSAHLATGHIVEDMKLGVDMARAGLPPLFCPDAEVISYFPDSLQGFKTQRQRWEHGHLGVILSDTPGLLATGIRHRDGRLVAMALDLAVPPLALLALLVSLAGIASIILALWLNEIHPLWASGLVIVLLLMGVVLAWAKFARFVITGRELAYAPLYALLKIPMYLRYVYNKQVAWVRSARKSD